MSAHYGDSQHSASSAQMLFRITHVVETARRVTVGNNLNGSIHTLGNVQASRELQSTSANAEVLRTLLLEGREKSDVEVGAGVISKSQQHLDLG